MLNNISQSWKAQINDNRVFILENKHNSLCNIYVKNVRCRKEVKYFMVLL